MRIVFMVDRFLVNGMGHELTHSNCIIMVFD